MNGRLSKMRSVHTYVMHRCFILNGIVLGEMFNVKWRNWLLHYIGKTGCHLAFSRQNSGHIELVNFPLTKIAIGKTGHSTVLTVKPNLYLPSSFATTVLVFLAAIFFNHIYYIGGSLYCSRVTLVHFRALRKSWFFYKIFFRALALLFCIISVQQSKRF